MFRKLRITILLYVLLLVAVGSWLSRARTTDWDAPLWVVVHPIAGDSTARTKKFIASLDDASFKDIETFFAREAGRYGLSLEQPFVVRRGAVLNEMPPVPPQGGNPISVMAWSLQLRWWSWGVAREHDDIPAHIRVYAIFHDPDLTPRVADSLGLQKGLIGVTHGFADRRMRRRNNVIVAHEMLHTVGATDKYDPATSLPRFPEGYAEPERSPLYPQRFAEIMGGRIAISAERAQTPSSLEQSLVGIGTAIEVRWRD